MFRRKKKKVTLTDVAYALCQLEPSRMDRLVEIAKDIRIAKRNLDVFVNGRVDDIDKLEKEVKKQLSTNTEHKHLTK